MAAGRLTRQESRQRTRERLLAAAVEVFSRQGYHAASVDEIAEAAGFSKGAVYSNFASKEDLFLALLDQRFEQEIAAGVEFFEQRAPRERLTGLGQSFPQRLEQDRAWNMLTLEFLLYALRHEAVQVKLAERYRTARHTIADLLSEQFAAAHGAPPMPVEYVVWILLALGTGIGLQGVIDPEALPADLYARAISHLFRTASHAAEEPQVPPGQQAPPAPPGTSPADGEA
jgi:AcrR family transcriptional regulator